MERMLKIFSMALLVSTAALATDNCCNTSCCTTNNCCNVAPYIYNRSVSENAARELAGWTSHVNLADMDKHYGSFSITPEYTRSFRPGNIARNLFGCDLGDCCAINIKGSGATPNGTTDWLADYFYLPTTYTGSFSVKPFIQNFLVDFNLYWGMDNWANGLYFRVHAPLAWTKWDLQMCMKRETAGTGTGIVDTNILTNTLTLKEFLNYSCNQAKPADITTVDPAATYKFNPLCYSRLCPCSHTKTRLSDIQADFGWNFLNDEDYHLGLFLRAVAPTGNRPHGTFLFEPMIGNGHAWELGGGLTSHVIMWRSQETQDKHFGLYVDANITHLFNARQCRFFDLCNKPWSRYNLAFKTTATNGVISQVEFAPVADLTAHAVKVSIGVQADVVAMFNYTNGNYAWDLGYNFWGRSCEKFDCKKCCTTTCATTCPTTCNTSCCKTDCCTCECPTFYSELDGATWSLAGANSKLYNVAGPIVHFPESYSDATIHSYDGTDGVNLVANQTENRTFLSTTDLDLDSARTKGISHKLFTSFTYNEFGCDNECWHPYMSIGGEVEFAGNKKCCNTGCTTTQTTQTTTTSCDPCCKKKCCNCINTAISQWGVWLKGGVDF